MLAKKNLAPGLTLLLLLLLFVSGCTPAGPRALLAGRQQLEAGNAPAAVEKFKLATSLMSSNAQAWNYLGLASHQAGQPAEALAAYQQAIKLDRDFVEARFNLGCLLAAEGKTSLARDAFTACTVLRPAYTDAWQWRARCELQLRELAAAESSVKEVLRQNPKHAEALNTLGLVQQQRSKPRDAAQSFAAALKSQPDHRAALLNLAIITHQQLNDRTAALALYRQYLALVPRPADWDAVNALAQSLQPPVTPVTPPPGRVIEAPAVTNPPAPKSVELAQRQTTNARPAPTNLTAPVKSSPVVQATSAPPEVVTLPPEPVIRAVPADENVTAPKPKPAAPTNPAPAKVAAETSTEKRGFLSRVNPFRKDPKPEPRATPSPDAASSKSNGTVSASDRRSIAMTSPAAGGFPRYAYLSPELPASGNTRECERLLAQGRREQDSRKLADAVQSYRSAVAADPGNFDAQFSLGYAAYQLRSYKLSAWAWEHALAIHPDSADARYNFALTLRGMDCVPDAAIELELVLRADEKLTKAHLTLGSIYAEQLKDVPKARLHYRRVLDLEPSHPRGAELRQWLVMNNRP